MKKFLAIFTAAVMTAGSVFSLAACDNNDDPKQDPPKQEQPGTDGPGSTSTPKIDEFYAKIAEFEAGSFALNGKVTGTVSNHSYDYGSGEIVAETIKVDYSAKLLASEDGLDAYFTGDVNDEDLMAMAFVRGTDAYVSEAASWTELGLEHGDFAGFLDMHREGGELSLAKSSFASSIPDMEDVELEQSVAYAFRLLVNLCFFKDGTLETTDNGYTLTCNPIASAAELVKSVSTALALVGKDVTISAMVNAAPVVGILNKLFDGIPATVVYEAFSATVSMDLSEIIPAPAENATVAEYLAQLVASEEFFATVVEENPFDDVKCFGDIKIYELISADDETVDGVIGSVQQLLATLQDPETFVESLLRLIMAEDYDEAINSFDVDVAFVFNFNADVDLTGMALKGNMEVVGRNNVYTPDGYEEFIETMSFELDVTISFESVELADLSDVNYVDVEVSIPDYEYPELEGEEEDEQEEVIE